MREHVNEFAMAMESKLKKHDDERGKAGWLNDETNIRYLVDCLNQEVFEAKAAFNDCNPEFLATECVDIANFAMMIRSRILRSNHG